MGRVRIKICGITTLDTMVAALDLGVDAVGLVFVAASPRAVSLATAAVLAARGPHMLKVGLFADAGDAAIAAAVAAGGLSALQLHGQEPPERVAEVKARFGLPVWKAVGVGSRGDVQAAVRAHGEADLLLFDARPPEGASRPGGHGAAFDWSFLDGAEPAGAWGLAGGLDAGNVGAAIRATGAPWVDVSSGVERAPGAKDVALMAAFVRAARGA